MGPANSATCTPSQSHRPFETVLNSVQATDSVGRSVWSAEARSLRSEEAVRTRAPRANIESCSNAEHVQRSASPVPRNASLVRGIHRHPTSEKLTCLQQTIKLELESIAWNCFAVTRALPTCRAASATAPLTGEDDRKSELRRNLVSPLVNGHDKLPRIVWSRQHLISLS